MAQELSPAFKTRNSRDDLVKDLNSPLSNISALPYETEFGFGPSPEHLMTYTMNMKPVVPISIRRNWLMISRLVVPMVYRANVSRSGSFGLGDSEVTLLLRPRKAGQLTWGVGSLWLLPTSTGADLGARKWGVGPAVAVVQQNQGWTIGTRIHHAWSFAGNGSSDVSATQLNSWMAYSWHNGLSARAETESTYDWKQSQWTVPLEFGLSKLLTDGPQPIDIGGDVLHYAARGPNDPVWGLRFSVRFVFAR